MVIGRSQFRLTVRATLLAAISCMTGCSEPQTPVTQVINNVTVIDSANGARSAQRVLIAGKEILSVTPMSTQPPELEGHAPPVVDGSDRFLLPGLWDMHVHFLYEPELTTQMASLFLRYGVTSVRDPGGNMDQLTALRRSLENASAPAPRIFIAGPLLDGRLVVYDGADPAQPALGTNVPDAATARQRVRDLQAAGADFIKIYELVGPDVFATLVTEARERNLPIASHVPLAMTADSAGPQADSMEHLRNIELACAANWRELLETRRSHMRNFVEGRGYELRRQLHSLQRLPAIEAYDEARCNAVLDTLRSTIQVPTLRLNTLGKVRPFEAADWAPALAELPESVQLRWQSQAASIRGAAPEADHRFADWSLFLIERLKARGVPVGAGTDTPIGLGIPGYSLHTELELLVRGGLTPAEALHAATVVPAAFFGLEMQMGLIEPGMKADLLLLDANPLEDIRNSRRIARVMLAGSWIN